MDLVLLQLHCSFLSRGHFLAQTPFLYASEPNFAPARPRRTGKSQVNSGLGGKTETCVAIPNTVASMCHPGVTFLKNPSGGWLCFADTKPLDNIPLLWLCLMATDSHKLAGKF